MLTLAVVSDIRWDADPDFTLGTAQADAWVVAGNLGQAARLAVDRLASASRDAPVVLVPGDRDLQGASLGQGLDRWRKAARGTNVKVLYRRGIGIGGVMLLGTTLWSDFMLFGKQNQGACRQAFQERNDSSKVAPIGPMEVEVEHRADQAWLKRRLQDPGPKILVTHFAPSARSLGSQPMDPGLAYCASGMDWVVGHVVAAIHGHVERPLRYQAASGAWVVANPRRGQCLARAPAPVPGGFQNPALLRFYPQGGRLFLAPS